MQNLKQPCHHLNKTEESAEFGCSVAPARSDAPDAGRGKGTAAPTQKEGTVGIYLKTSRVYSWYTVVPNGRLHRTQSCIDACPLLMIMICHSHHPH